MCAGAVDPVDLSTQRRADAEVPAEDLGTGGRRRQRAGADGSLESGCTIARTPPRRPDLRPPTSSSDVLVHRLFQFEASRRATSGDLQRERAALLHPRSAVLVDDRDATVQEALAAWRAMRTREDVVES